jgi:ABC-type nitrate/sulfonate/bicarbonate transport system ATPase subunit
MTNSGFDSLANKALESHDAPTNGVHVGTGFQHSKSGDYALREVLVRATDVSLSFGDTVILKPISIEVRNVVRPGCEQGQVIGFLGPSGIGKSQFSRILTGLQQPTGGEVLLADFDKDPSGNTLRKTEAGMVGMVAQDYPLFSWRTVLGNLIVAQEHSTLSPKEKIDRAMEHLASFDVADVAGKYAAQLSGGQRQRVAILRQLLSDKRFFSMDEPFTGLDPIAKDRVCDRINHIASLHEFNTIFVVAHDITALCQISDQLWLFGRDRDENGKPLPGASIKQKFDLIERGLAWQPGLYETQPFVEFVREVRAAYRTL